MDNYQIYIGVFLFIIFMVMDIVLYSFEAALGNFGDPDIDKKAEEGNKKAIRLKKLLEDSQRFGDTLDVVVFVTNLIAGGYILGVVRNLIVKETGTDSIWFLPGIGAAMFLILVVFGVLIPKNIGKRSPNKTAYNMVGAAGLLIGMFFPVVFAVRCISRFFLRLFGIDPDEKTDNVTEEEIITMVNEGQEQGVLEASEAEMITNIFEFGEKNAGDIMTHRSAIEALDTNTTLENIIQTKLDGKYSRFPVYEGDIDNIIGTMHIRDALILYRNIPNRKKQIGKLKNLLREPLFVPATRDIDDLLKEMQAEKVHMGIVIDEYGQTAGIISMEDIIEEIVGNILDEYDVEEKSVEHTDDETYVVDGLIQLEDLQELLDVKIESEEYDTLNGFLISILDRIPDEDETEEVKACGFVFKIQEVSGNVIRKVEIVKDNETVEDSDGTDTEAGE